MVFNVLHKKLLDIYNCYAPLLKSVDSRVSKTWVIGRSAFSIKGRYCYFRIPKCANSTVTKTLAYYDPSINYDGKNDNDGKIAKSKFFTALSANIYTKHALKKYFLFTFVRNPYTRVLSAYLDKIDSNNNAFDSIRHKIRTFSANKDVTFEAFITYLENGGLFDNPHWVPQSLLIPLPISEISFVGKVESIEHDLSVIINLLFGQDTYQDVIIREHNRRGSQKIASSYYTDTLETRVYNLYKTDFERFSYPINLTI